MSLAIYSFVLLLFLIAVCCVARSDQRRFFTGHWVAAEGEPEHRSAQLFGNVALFVAAGVTIPVGVIISLPFAILFPWIPAMRARQMAERPAIPDELRFPTNIGAKVRHPERPVPIILEHSLPG